jgi:hypothetical protein
MTDDPAAIAAHFDQLGPREWERFDRRLGDRVSLELHSRLRRLPQSRHLARVVTYGTISVLLLGGCFGSDIVALSPSDANRRVVAGIGDRVEITLQNVGPGEYGSPPAISSNAVTFIDVGDVEPFVPAGVTQRFRFHAAARGLAIITFTHSDHDPTVQDTVLVR